MKRPKHIVLSPDGISIEFGVSHYNSKKKSIEAFDKWKKRYVSQGYYSSSRFGRIPLSELADYCTFTTIKN